MTEGTNLGDFLTENGKQHSPAAPAGMQPNPGGGGTSRLSQWLGDNGANYAEMAQAWYTGANPQGTNNGWDSSFVDAFVNDWGQSLEEGTAKDYFDRDNATGVVTWDHKSEKSGKDRTFGDVYENGKYTGNLYDKYERDTANLMMAPWLLDAKTQAETFSASDRMERLDRELRGVREDRTENFVKSLEAQAFQSDVDDRAEGFREGIVDEGLVAGGAAGGAAVGAGAGAAAGSFFFGAGAVPGAAIGGAIGGVAGGVGAFLNRDSLTEQAARAAEITSISYEDFGLGAGISTGVSQWSGVAGRLITPMSNITQGTYDWAKGEGGDGKSEFYRVTEEGKSSTPRWVKAIDVGATVGDSLLQFSSPIGVTMFSAQMTGTIGGEVAELGFTGGETFDYRRGGFDNIFTDDDGNTDLSAAAAGIGKIGIDAVQLGMARGLAGKTNALRTGGATAAGAEGSLYRTGMAGMKDKLPLWMGGSKGLSAGQQRVRAGGFSFTRGADGAIVEGSRRATLGLLAPSEQIAALSARHVAMRTAAKKGGAATSDDFYRAAQSLATGERRIASALVNAFGEGYEEAAQAVLEPHSHGSVVDVDELISSAIYGAAAGAGMSLGTSLRAPNADAQMSALARVAQEMYRGGLSMTDREWNDYWGSLPDLEKRAAAAMGGLDREVAEAAYRKLSEEQAIEQVAGYVGSAKLQDAIQSQLSQQLSRATDRTDGAFVITQLEDVPKLDARGNLLPGAIPVDGVAASAVQTALNLTNHRKGAAIQLQTLRAQVAELEEKVAADPADTDSTERLADAMRKADMTELALRWGQAFDQVLDDKIERIMDPNATPITIEADVEELNDLLRGAFNQRFDTFGGVAMTEDDKLALARSVSMVFARDPHDSAGSYQMLVPQVSARLTMAGANDLLEISHAILPALRGDYDGDKIRPLNQLILDENEFVSARAGLHFVGAGSSVNVGAPKWEKYNVENLATGLTSDNLTLQGLAQATLFDINRAVTRRYQGVVDPTVLQEVLERFFTAVRANDKDARSVLLDGLAEHGGGAITEFARENLSNEWLWLDQVIVANFQRFQEAHAAHRPDVGDKPSTTQGLPIQQEAEVRTRMAERSATHGQTLANFAAGDSLFRKFQKLHYTVLGAPVLSANNVEPTTANEMILLYRELGQQVTRTELDNLRGKDDISIRVYAQLLRIADDAQALYPQLNRYEALNVIANLRVADFEISEQGEWTETGKQVSLAQVLLKQSIMVDRREKARIFDASPELQAKHARLMKMTRPNSRDYANGAEQTFVEVVGSQQLFTLLGDDAAIFGPHLTVEQFVRKYVDLSEQDRYDMTRVLQGEPQYLGRRQTKDMPYDLTEVLDKQGRPQISAYRALVDSILAVGNGRISIDNGKLHGEIAERSDRVSSNFRDAHGQARRALQEFAGLSPRQDGELTVELVQRMLESNPDFARQVMNLVPNAAAAASFEQRNGQTYAANWLFEMFTISDSVEAEMYYWRNLLLAEWNALGASASLTEEEALDGVRARQYDRLPRRMHRIIYMLNQQGDNKLMLQKFINELESATDLNEFIRWVNTTPGVRGQQAPITAWVDDVAEFDVDKAQGGWTTALQGAELREAIGMLKTRADNLVGSLVAERTAMHADIRTMAAIRRVLKKDRGEDVTLDTGDRVLYERFAKSIELAGERRISMGPQAMIFQTVHAVQGFYAQAHTKGKNPSNVEMAGMLDATRDAYDFVTNYERMLASLTSVNLDAVGSNLGEVAKDAGRTMDDHGRQIEWGKLTPENMLELLENPDTRPYARAVLFPQVMERNPDGVLRPQLLVGKSLSELLNGTSFKELFPRNGKLSQQAAFKYVSMVEGVARKYGGHFSVQRAVNDLVIARTSSADHALTVFEIEDMTTRAYYEVAQVLQAVGALASQRTDPGSDPLSELMAEVKQAQRRLRTARALGIETEDVELVTDVMIETFIQERELESERRVQDLLEQIEADPSSEVRLQAQIETESLELDRFRDRVNILRTDDVAGQVVEMFSITGDATEQAAKRQMLVEYVLGNLNIIERASASKMVLNKLTQQMLDHGRNGQVDLSDKEWSEVSRAVIAVYLEDAATSVAAGISVAPWADEDRADDHRYFDSSFSYLVEKMLSQDSPLTLAAREVHRVSGRLSAPVPTKAEFYDLLGRTVLDGKRLGPWTSDIPRASIEANQRLDSAAAAPAIAMAGNSPKRQATLIAASRRTFQLPDPALLSRVTLGREHLDGAGVDTVEVQLPGQPAATEVPLAQLNNRFARTVVLTGRDKDTQDEVVLDLLAEARDLGRKWHSEQSVRDSGYVEIHLSRVGKAIEAAMARHNLSPEFQVTAEFFHPDSQPAGPEWTNNIYFEGTSFKLDADRHESLLSTLWFANESISPAAQASALDASKLGLAALQVIEAVGAEERASIEANWATNLAAVLRVKTNRILTTDLGFGRLDPEFFNAIYKDMKLRHYVRGRTPEGNLALWTSEQVIEFQLANPGAPLPLEDASLWVPTDDVLRSMLGEQGTQGVARLFEDQLEIDPSRVRTFRQVTDEMISRFEAGVAGQTSELHKTRISNRAHQSQLTVRTKLDEQQRSAFDQKMLFFQERETEIHTDRSSAQRDQQDGGFNANRNLKAAIAAGVKMLRAENLSLHWQKIGIPFGPRDPSNLLLSKMLLKDLESAMEPNQYRTGWIYREGSAAKPPAGLLSQVSLQGKDRPAFRVAPRDLVVIEIDSFQGDSDTARKRIDYLADNGAIVVLGATDGQADLRAELAEYLVSDRNYEHIAGSTHAYQPAEYGTRYQNPRARNSTLLETRGVSRKNRVAVFSTTGLPIQEGAAWVEASNERLSAIGVVADLVPTSAFGGFNVPVEGFSNESQIEKVRAHIRGLDNAAGRKFLKEQANGHLGAQERVVADGEFDAAFDALLQRFDTNAGVVLPQPGDQFGKGDIIPLVDSTGRVLLYRHGYKAPTRDQINELTARTVGTSYEAANVAVYPTKLEGAATVHTGEVVEFKPRSGYGLSVELNLPLSVFGDKKQLEMNGMKYVLTPKTDSVVVPEHGFFENWGIDLISDADTLLSKEAVADMVDNHRNAFAYFGIDFLPDATEFFFPGKRDSASAQAQTREILHTIATQGDRISVRAAHELINSARLGTAFIDQLPAAAKSADWNDLTIPENKITAAMVVYLLTPGARVEDVLRSGGFNSEDVTLEGQSRLMPRLFTQAFDLAPLGSDLRRNINRRLNEQIYNPNNDGTGYRLHEDFTFEVRNADASKNLRGFLSFAEAHSSGDNPVKNGQAFDDLERGTVSQHSAAIAYGAIGAETAYSYDISKARLFAEGKGVTRFERDVLDGGAWRMLTDIPKSDKSFHSWTGATPAEALRRDLAREAVVMFRQPLGQEDADGWTDALRKDYKDKALQIVRTLGLQDSQVGVVDFWVRQVMGAPHGLNEDGKDLGKLSGKAAIQAAQEVLENVERRYLPVFGAEVPQLHVHDLQAIYRANKTWTMKWQPREGMSSESVPAESWNDWVHVALGSALVTDVLFDPMYLLALDGFMHTYQNATRSLMDLPVSVDVLVQKKLMDPEMNRSVVSVMAQANTAATETLMLDVDQATLEDVIGGRRIAGKLKGKRAPASEVAKRRELRRKWRRENDIPVPVDVTMRNFRQNGVDLIDHGTNTSALVRGLINLRVGTALINPALWVSAGPEMLVRGSLDRAANILTGQSTTGLTGRLHATATEKLDDTRVGQALEALGLNARYTPTQLTELNKLYRVLGQRSDFKRMIFRELNFLRPKADGLGRIERGLEAYAKFGSRMQDPTYGMRGTTLARRYLDAALQHILANPTANVISVENLIAQMMTNPTFLEKNFPEAHHAGANSIAQIRSLKDTPLSLSLKGVYEPLSESSNALTNFLGNVVLKIPLLFSGFASNVATTVLGLQGLSDMTAMFLDGRSKGPNSLIGRAQAKMRGEEFTPDRDAQFDMTTVLEGVDLTRSFIRGGLTHTALFSFGLMAGGLGLSGEDDEAKRRRLMAKHQGLGHIYDPRSIENDFRNADAIFSDLLPFGMGEGHWMIRQFLSPIMGFEKFYETGDFRHVGWGFQDALASFPLINTQMWNNASETAAELANMADEEAELGQPENLVKASLWLTEAVGVYERMLFESSFVNQLYIGLDAYDRDPYVLPLRDSDGDLQKDIEGNTRENDLATQSYMDENGQVAQGYLGRRDAASQARVMAENRATFALISSLFTGGIGDSDMWRYNMPVKTRDFELKSEPMEQMKAKLLAAFQGSGGVPNLTIDEAEAAVRTDLYERDGIYYPDSVVLPIAGDVVKQAGQALMVETDSAGREHLTDEGAKTIFESLLGGSVKLGDASLAGAYITFEQRNQIQKDWMKDIVQEGIDLGLDQTKATSRMKRIWYGPLSDPDVVGLGEILWSKDISFQDTQTYAQLNTTYVKGPDGRMWATGFERGNLMNALGLKPYKSQIQPEGGAVDVDGRGNTVDLVNGLNTGLRALVPLDDSRNVPTDVEIGKAIEKAIEEAAGSEYTPFTPFASSGGGSGWRNFGSGWRNFGGYGGRRGGGGGGGGGGYFVRMNNLPQDQAPYGHNAPYVNTGNPIIRRADVRRERVWGDRGRLKQWQ